MTESNKFDKETDRQTEKERKSYVMLGKVKSNFLKAINDLEENGRSYLSKYDKEGESSENSDENGGVYDSKNSFKNSDVCYKYNMKTNCATIESVTEPIFLNKTSSKVSFYSQDDINEFTIFATLPETKTRLETLKDFFLRKVQYESLMTEDYFSRFKNTNDFSRQKEDGGFDKFIISSIGFSIGFGNLWRFPLKCMEAGGGSFLIAYFILLIFIAVPIFFFEMALGQFTGRGQFGAYHFVPASKGVGMSNIMMCFLMSSYYNAILLWSLIYSFNCFRYPLWTTCDNSWNVQPCSILGNQSLILSNRSKVDDYTELATHQFFHGVILSDVHVSNNHEIHNDSIMTLSRPKWYLVVGSLFIWIIIYLNLVIDFDTIGIANYVTLFAPFLLLYLILITTATLPGADLGLKHLFITDFGKLWEVNTWNTALEQSLYTLTISGGFRTAESSTGFNTFNSNFYKDLKLIVCGHVFISILSAAILFQLLGHHAYLTNTTVAEMHGSPGIIFIVTSTASTNFGTVFGNILCFTFFSIYSVVGFKTQSGFIRFVATYFMQEFPKYFKTQTCNKAILISLICFLGFCSGIPFITPEGYIWIYAIDNSSLYTVIILGTVFKTILLSYCYGCNKICEDIFMMIKHKVNRFWILSWKIICPLTSLAIYLSSLFIHEFHYLENIFAESVPYKKRYNSLENIEWLKGITCFISVTLISPFLLIPAMYFIDHIYKNKEGRLKTKCLWLVKECISWGPIKKSNWLISKRYTSKLKQAKNCAD